MNRKVFAVQSAALLMVLLTGCSLFGILPGPGSKNKLNGIVVEAEIPGSARGVRAIAGDTDVAAVY
ncbi:MAG: hypothetical protein WHT81_06760, partial [Rectinemataceae bacterium]